MRYIPALFLVVLFSAQVFAAEPDEMLKDSALETRAVNIGQELRCLVCQGEAIEESGAAFAADIRKLVRHRIMAGDSDDQVLEYVRERYGDYILLKPPFSAPTFLLWLSPFIVLAGGLFVVLKNKKRST